MFKFRFPWSKKRDRTKAAPARQQAPARGQAALSPERLAQLEKEGSTPSVGVSRTGRDLGREGLTHGMIDTSPTIQAGRPPYDIKDEADAERMRPRDASEKTDRAARTPDHLH